MDAYFASHEKYGPLLQETRGMTDYLTVAEVLAIHADQIERYCGSHGIREAGLAINGARLMADVEET